MTMMKTKTTPKPRTGRQSPFPLRSSAVLAGTLALLALLAVLLGTALCAAPASSEVWGLFPAWGLFCAVLPARARENALVRAGDSSASERGGGGAACESAWVYNKPPKTASSFIQQTIANWSAASGRTSYICSQRPLHTNLNLRECLPPPPAPLLAPAAFLSSAAARLLREAGIGEELGLGTGEKMPVAAATTTTTTTAAAAAAAETEAADSYKCGMVNCHIYLDEEARRILGERLPGYRLLTSTRHPAHRIVSFFLEMRKLRHNSTNTDMETDLQAYLRMFNPWLLYNYHTGASMRGTCPLTEEETMQVARVAARFDVVIDVNVRNVSNAILRANGLPFNLPAVPPGSRNKDRGAYRLRFGADTQRLLKRAACVEVVLHRAMQRRMASLYQAATGVPCFHLDSTCVGDYERYELAENWIF